MTDALKHAVFLLSSVGMPVLVAIISYIFTRRASASAESPETIRYENRWYSSGSQMEHRELGSDLEEWELKAHKKQQLSRGIVVLVSLMVGIVGILSGLDSFYNGVYGRQAAHTGGTTRSSQGALPPTKLCSEDPFGKPYAREISFLPEEFQERFHNGGMDVSAHASKSDQPQVWQYSVELPGPVAVVTATPTGQWITIESCDTVNNRVTCRGTVSEDKINAKVNLNVKWQQPCPR